MRFLLVTGLSGAGKTVATRYLEDMGAFCVDNLPPMMMLKFMEACQTSAMHCKLVALAVDIRSGEFFDAKAVSKLIKDTQQLGYQIETLFIEAGDDVLVSRYKETRRDHPLAGENVTLMEAITQERERLQPLRETANLLLTPLACARRHCSGNCRPSFLLMVRRHRSGWRLCPSASSAVCPARRT